MKIFNSLFLCLGLLFTCCNRQDEPVRPKSYTDHPIVACKEIITSLKTYGSEGNKASRGWEGELDPNAQFLPTVYPLDKIYLLVADNLEANWDIGYSVLEFDVYSPDDKRRVFDICFRAEGEKVWAKNGTDSVLVADSDMFECRFSSQPNIHVEKDLCNVFTEGSRIQTYEPYGDRLFFSEEYYFFARNGIIKVFPNTPVQNMVLNMDRITNVIIPRFLVSDNLLPPGTEFPLDYEKFKKELGPAENWEIRAFIDGLHTEDDDCLQFPVEYNLVNKIVDPERGIISISENWQDLNYPFKHSTISTGGIVSNYTGVGYHSLSAPFIFPAETAGKADLCFTLRYKGDEKEFNLKRKSNTFRMHATENLYPGELRLVTVIIDVDDMIGAFKNESSRNGNKNIRRYNDPIWGEITEIPYKIITE